MAGLDPTTPAPTEIKLHQKSRLMELTYADGRPPCFPSFARRG